MAIYLDDPQRKALARFLVKGYSEWLRLYAFASVAYPVYGDPSDAIQENPPAADTFAGKLPANS